MKCINCGAEIKPEFKICPYCGTTLQIVPDYSVYDEDNINLIVENVQDVEKKPEITKEQRDARALAKQKAAEAAQKRKMQLTIAFIAIACMLLVIIGVVAKVFIDTSNKNSFSHQMSLGNEAKFKGKIEEAEKYYLNALGIEPNNVEVRLKMADLYLDSDEIEQAEKYLKEAIALDKENYEAYRLLYNIYVDAEDTKAILKLKEGVTNSKILALFKDYTVVLPTISPEGGNFTEDIRVTITAKKGIEIYYSLDGTDPRYGGTKYKSSFEIKGVGMHTLKVVTKNDLGVYGDVVTEIFVIDYEAPEDPVVTPSAGKFDQETYIVVKIPSGCSAYYTWDSEVTTENPTVESEKYVSPILIPEGRNMLSVIIIDDETGLESGVYRGWFEYTAEDEE